MRGFVRLEQIWRWMRDPADLWRTLLLEAWEGDSGGAERGHLLLQLDVWGRRPVQRADSGGFLEFEFGGVAEEEKGKLEIRRQKLESRNSKMETRK
jgi:hypothetical protein